MCKAYIHYGHANYIPEMFTEIKNRFLFTKPYGGLWGAPKGSSRGWKGWCEEQNFALDKLSVSFQFGLTPGANVLRINSGHNLAGLPIAEFTGVPEPLYKPFTYLDFEKLLAEGIDAILLNINYELYHKLYGWDCDSILVMNKEVITIL
jgi:hypothetical protein